MFLFKVLKVLFYLILNLLILTVIFLGLSLSIYVGGWFYHYNIDANKADFVDQPFIFSYEIDLDYPRRLVLLDLSPVSLDLSDATVNDSKPLWTAKGFIFLIETKKLETGDSNYDYKLQIPYPLDDSELVEGTLPDDIRYATLGLITNFNIPIIPLVALSGAIYLLLLAVLLNRGTAKRTLAQVVKSINERYYLVDEWPNLLESEDPEVKWCYIMAKNGSKEAQYELSVMFMNGYRNIIPINKEAALVWLEKAALQAHPLATQLYQAISAINL